jgi:hypothetical protein
MRVVFSHKVVFSSRLCINCTVKRGKRAPHCLRNAPDLWALLGVCPAYQVLLVMALCVLS